MPITIHTRQSRARGAWAAWVHQYGNGGTKEQQATRVALRDLGPDASPDRVDEIIGNSSWTDPGHCDNCGARPPVIAEVGEEPSFESSTAKMCITSLEKALTMAREATP